MVHESLVVAKLVVLALGVTVAGVAFLSWRRTKESLMLWVAVAFFVLALGSSAEGLFFELLEWDLLTVHTVESVGVLAGLLILLGVLRPGSRARGGQAPQTEAAGSTEPEPGQGAKP